MSDTEKDAAICNVCGKGFASEMAFSNHARMEHFDEYLAEGNNLCEKPFTRLKPRKLTKEEENESVIKTEQMLSSMEPIDLITLASNDVDYVIIKAEDEFKPRKRKRDKGKERKGKKEKDAKDSKVAVTVKKERVTKLIKGPFECMQLSTHSAEGLCHQIFMSCCDYSAHYRDEHTRRRIGPRCQICEKPLPGLDLDTLYPCQVCGIGFQCRKDLADHSQSAHANLKPFQCNICEKRFSQQGGLQSHMRMHTGEKPYICPVCPKGFTQKSGCEQHLRIHTNEKPYRCVLCPKAFVQSIHLQQHMRTHTNVAPFECLICQKRFKQKSHLNCHMRKHNSSNMTEEQKAKYDELVHSLSEEVIEVEVEVDHVTTEVMMHGENGEEMYILGDI